MNLNNLTNKQVFELSVIQHRYDQTLKAIEDLPKRNSWFGSYLDEETEKAEKVLTQYAEELYQDYNNVLKQKNQYFKEQY